MNQEILLHNITEVYKQWCADNIDAEEAMISISDDLEKFYAAQQQRVPDEAVCAPEIHALPGEETIGDCLFCGKPLRR